MGVYINGIEMPKDDCAVYKRVVISNYFIDGEMKILAHDDITDVFIGEVIDVPEPHGRLIDADALEKLLSRAWDVTDEVDFCNKSVWHILGDAPTIIEGSDT